MFSYFEKIKLFFKKNDSLLFIILIIIFGIVASRSLFLPGFYSSHDGVSHVIRLVKFYEGLIDGQIIPRWSKGLAFGFGSPVLLFYGQLPYLVGLIPKLLGFSYASSIEIIFGLSLIVSGITFYLWAKEVTNKSSALIGSILYIYAPYRFLDIYVRGAYPESFAFIFPPLILLSLYKIFYKSEKSGYLLGVFSLSGIILSHNVMALFFIPVFILYALGLFFVNKDKKKLIVTGISLLTSLVITSFYWIPAFFEKNLVNLNNLDAASGFTNNFVGLKDIIYSKWAWGPLGSTSPMSLQVGLVQQGIILLSIFVLILFLLRKNKLGKLLSKFLNKIGLNVSNKLEKLDLIHFGLFFFLFAISIFLITNKSQFLWNSIPLLSFVLYPWRFLAISLFSSAILSAFVFKYLKPNIIFYLIIIFVVLYSNRNYSQLVGKIYENDNFYENYQDTADMWGEFLPITANLETINKCRKEQCKFNKVVVPNKVKINIITDKSNLLVFSYESEKDFTATINTYYFPGWKVYLDKSFYDQRKVNGIGTMDINLPKGSHNILLKFENTNIINLSLIISLVGLLGFGICLKCLKK
jgi:hypothetical protein